MSVLLMNFCIHILFIFSLILESKYALRLVDANVETHPKDFKLTPLFKMGLQDVLQSIILSPGRSQEKKCSNSKKAEKLISIYLLILPIISKNGFKTLT